MLFYDAVPHISTIACKKKCYGLRLQVTCLVQRLGEDLEAWDLLSEPTVLLLQSLLRLPSTKEVTIVDGRVADGCPIWIFASRVLVKVGRAIR